MSARLMALCCLLILAVLPGWTGSNSASSPNLVLYLKTAPSQPQGPVNVMKREVDALMSSAGFRVEWRDEHSASRNAEDAELVVVELRPASRDAALASTAISNGKVLPFSWVNCDALARLLGPQPDFIYGRAMARLLAHELYHVTAHTREHGRAGISKPAFSRRELLSERFDFAPGTW